MPSILSAGRDSSAYLRRSAALPSYATWWSPSKLTKRVWENKMLTENTKVRIYRACVLSTLLYGSESWTTYMCQERRLNTIHMRCLKRIIGITWQDRIPYSDILDRARIRSMYSLLSQRRLRWLGHVRRMEAACRKTSSMDNSPVARGQWDAQPSDSGMPAIVT